MNVIILGIIVLSVAILCPFLFAKWTDEPRTRSIITLFFALAFSGWSYYAYYDVDYPELLLRDCKECPGSSLWNIERLYFWLLLSAGWLWLSAAFFAVYKYIAD